MGLVIDTNVFVRAERGDVPIDFDRWRDYGAAFISVVTVSELLVGVHRADTAARRERRLAFVEAIIAAVPALDFTAAVARTHAALMAQVDRSMQVPAHDALIGATARHHGHAVLTANRRDFERLPGVEVVGLEAPRTPPAE